MSETPAFGHFVYIDPAENEMPEDYQVLAGYYGDMRVKWERRAQAQALRDAADNPGARLSGHSGVSVNWLRARAAELEARS